MSLVKQRKNNKIKRYVSNWEYFAFMHVIRFSETRPFCPHQNSFKQLSHSYINTLSTVGSLATPKATSTLIILVMVVLPVAPFHENFLYCYLSITSRLKLNFCETLVARGPTQKNRVHYGWVAGNPIIYHCKKDLFLVNHYLYISNVCYVHVTWQIIVQSLTPSLACSCNVQSTTMFLTQ